MDDAFAAALEQAIRVQAQQRVRSLAIAAVLVCALLALVAVCFIAHLDSRVLELACVPFFIGIGWVVRNVSFGSLEHLRGAEPQHWAPSTSHGVLVVTKKEVLAGGLAPLPLDKLARSRRCAGAGYDEEKHAIIIQESAPRTDARGETVDRYVRHWVKLPSSVSPDQGLELALYINRKAEQ